jgi:hypothetical protein
MATSKRMVDVLQRGPDLFIIPYASLLGGSPWYAVPPILRLAADTDDHLLGVSIEAHLAESRLISARPDVGDIYAVAGIKTARNSGSAGVRCVFLEAFADGRVVAHANRTKRGWGFEPIGAPEEITDPTPEELAGLVRRGLEAAE